MQDSWEQDIIQSLRFEALVREEDEWDEVSILELHEEEGEARQQCLADLECDGLPVPVPWEAWVERQKQLCEEQDSTGQKVPKAMLGDLLSTPAGKMTATKIRMQQGTGGHPDPVDLSLAVGGRHVGQSEHPGAA